MFAKHVIIGKSAKKRNWYTFAMFMLYPFLNSDSDVELTPINVVRELISKPKQDIWNYTWEPTREKVHISKQILSKSQLQHVNHKAFAKQWYFLLFFFWRKLKNVVQPGSRGFERVNNGEEAHSVNVCSHCHTVHSVLSHSAECTMCVVKVWTLCHLHRAEHLNSDIVNLNASSW